MKKSGGKVINFCDASFHIKFGLNVFSNLFDSGCKLLMLGIFDFKDALRMLFKMQEACKNRTLEDFRGKKLGIDFRFLNYFILILKNWSDTSECMRFFKQKLAAYDIDFTVVFKGVEFFRQEYLIRPFYYIQWTREKYFFFNLIYQYLPFVDSEHRALLKQILSIRFLGREDTFVLYSHYLQYQNYFRQAMETHDVAFLRAPQFIDNQLLYLLETKQVDYIKASPLGFLVGDLQSIIAEIDVDTGKVVTYEWEMFCQSLDMESKLLKRCLVGSMMYFLCHSSVKADNKFCKSITEKIENFPAKFHELAAANMKLVLRHIDFLKSRIDPDAPVDESFCIRIANLFNLEPQRVLDYCALLYNSIVMTPQGAFEKFPTSAALPSTKLLVNTKHPALLFMFCRQYMDEEIFNLMNDCLDHKAVVFNPRFEFVEFDFAYKSFFKDNLEQALSKIVAALPSEAGHSFKFRFFTDPIVALTPQAFTLPVLAPRLAPNMPVNCFTVMLSFYTALNKKEPLQGFAEGEGRPSAARVLAYLRFAVMSSLGYCNQETKTILIPGAGLLEAGAHPFTDELVIMFELLRNALMKPDFFTQEKPLLSNYEDLMEDNVFESLIRTSEEAEQFLNEFSIHDQSINDSIAGGPGSRESLPNVVGRLNRPNSSNLRQSLTKCLNMYYKVIKDFQKDFVSWHQPQPLFLATDEILTLAFRNSALVKVQIISRVFTFACSNYVLDEFFDIDSSRYEAIINIIKRGLNAQTIGSLIYFAYKTGKQADLPLLEETCKLALFRKNYSVAAGTLMKILLTKLLVYRALLQKDEDFAVQYRKNFRLDFIKQEYQTNFDLLAFLQNGKTLFTRLYKMLQSVKQYHQSNIFDPVCDNGAECVALINSCIELVKSTNAG